MRIAFYAPLKAPDHPVPSGDRRMARQIVAALGRAGHEVEVVSTHRGFQPTPDRGEAAARDHAAAGEVDRIARRWDGGGGAPDLVFAYHPYYKAPDRIGWPLARRFGRPYVTAEASYAAKRDAGPWAGRQALVVEAVRGAALNLCLTANDRCGLAAIAAPDRLADLPPFLDAAGFSARGGGRRDGGCEIVALAMMRPGDKLASYRFLAAALAGIAGADWRLSVVGDGPARPAVEDAFAGVPPARIRWLGELPQAGVAAVLAGADLLAWPGFGEAYGLCYLEAAACGLPAVAVRGAGTASVIADEVTGLLAPPEAGRYGAALARLIADPALRERLGAAAAGRARGERSLPAAAARLDAAVRRAMATTHV